MLRGVLQALILGFAADFGRYVADGHGHEGEGFFEPWWWIPLVTFGWIWWQIEYAKREKGETQ